MIILDHSIPPARFEIDSFRRNGEGDNEVIAEAFRKRLKQVAGFRYVPKPLPMRNTRNAIVYYLFFASPNRTGGTIVEGIFNSYRNRTG